MSSTGSLIISIVILQMYSAGTVIPRSSNIFLYDTSSSSLYICIYTYTHTHTHTRTHITSGLVSGVSRRCVFQSVWNHQSVWLPGSEVGVILAVTELQRNTSCNRAATAYCNPELQQSCNRAATELQQSCNRAATAYYNPTSDLVPACFFLGNYNPTSDALLVPDIFFSQIITPLRIHF
jgi:hypothetical protein